MLKEDEDLQAILHADDNTIQDFLQLVVHPADIVELIRDADPSEWPRLLHLITDEAVRAEVVAELSEAERSDLLEHMPTHELGSLLSAMDPNDAADVVAELEPQEQQDVLSSLSEADRRDVETLMSYPEDSAGGIMDVERAQVLLGSTIAQAINCVRLLREEDLDVYHICVLDQDGHLQGLVNLVDLVLNRPERLVNDVMKPVAVYATPLMDQEEVASLFAKYDLVTLPVLNDNGQLLGRVVFDDVVDVLEEEAEEDALLQAGTNAEELLYRDQAFAIARIRLPWIGINLVGSLVSSVLLTAYGAVLGDRMIGLLAAFIPVVAATGGNVGTQSSTIVARGLATGRITVEDVLGTILRELRVGVLMGSLAGFGMGLIAPLFLGRGHQYIGLIVAMSMFCTMTVAAVVGAVAPVTMKRLGIDPAIASGPLVTTVNDITGIVIYMSTALLFLKKYHSLVGF